MQVVHDHEPFVSPTRVSGFTTGDQGMGHIVLGTPDIGASTHFYRDVLGFRISDYWRPDGSEHDVVFLHCNPRHHSLALVPADQSVLYHFMLEMNTLDDVGYTLDRHEATGTPISAGLGKHTNDHMVSFYSVSPLRLRGRDRLRWPPRRRPHLDRGPAHQAQLLGPPSAHWPLSIATPSR